MAANFYGGIFGFGVALVTTLTIGFLCEPAEPEPRLQQASDQQSASVSWPAVAAAIGLAGLFVAFNVAFW